MGIFDLPALPPLFEGVEREEMQDALRCLAAHERSYAQGEMILRAGDTAVRLGLVLSGSVHIIRYDAWGAQSILDSVGPGQIFAETYACLQDEPLMVYAVAAERTEVLFLDVSGLTDDGTCGFHGKILGNLLRLMARKNLMLTRKMNCITPRTIRARLLSYLSIQAAAHNASSFTIPFDRQQLADYLSVERSALSGELSRMRRDGLISYRKNQFTLHCDEVE